MADVAEGLDMSAPWAKKQDLSAFDDLDIDDLLAQLTPEEIEQLENEVDPDNSLLPPSERCGTQTKKAPTGPLDRKALIKWLEDKAKNEKDWDEAKPYTKSELAQRLQEAQEREKKGKVYVPKEEERGESKDQEEEEIHTDFDDILNQATEEELVDLAAALGFHAMLNQDQFQASVEDKPIHGGFQGIAKATVPMMPQPVTPNTTDVEASIEKLSNNDSSLTELNLNNIKTISTEKYNRLFTALESNTTLTKLCVASTGIAETSAKSMAAMLRKNKTLKTIVADSNYIKRDMIVELLQACNVNQTIIELSLDNQKPALLGVKSEQAIAQLIEANDTIEKLGLHLETINARIRVQDKLQSNFDKHRKQRNEK